MFLSPATAACRRASLWRRRNTRFRKNGLSANRSESKHRSRLRGNRRVALLGPFGEPIVTSGTVAAEMPFRFSTKYQDVETGLLYYGYRYYGSIAGRWLSRDPIEEAGGVNLYALVLNDPSNWIDVLGLSKPTCEEYEKNYPKSRRENGGVPGVTAGKVYDDVGGWLDKAHDDPVNIKNYEYQDSCALRASIALNGCGGPHKIPASKGPSDGINRVPDGKKPKDNVIISAAKMCAYMEKQFGKPDYEGEADFVQMRADSDKACGCYCFVSCSDVHVSFHGAQSEPDSEPINGRTSGKVKGWKLPCKNDGSP